MYADGKREEIRKKKGRMMEAAVSILGNGRLLLGTEFRQRVEHPRKQ